MGGGGAVIVTSKRILAGLAATAVALAGLAACSPGKKEPAVVVGVPDGTATATSGPQVVTSDPAEHEAAEAAPSDVFVDAAPFGGGGGEPARRSAPAAPNGKPWAA